MKRQLTRLTLVSALLGTIALTSCNLIDDDLSDCGNFDVTYEARLVTNYFTEMDSVLGRNYSPVRSALDGYLKGIFVDTTASPRVKVDDLHLSFFPTAANDPLFWDDVTMNAEVMTYGTKMYEHDIKAGRYMHVAVGSTDAVLSGSVLDATSEPLTLDGSYRQHADTVGCQPRGIYSARYPMELTFQSNQQFYVPMYMANCATCLVVDTTGCGFPIDADQLRVCANGFASSFSVADSTYRFTDAAAVRADVLPVAEGSQFGYVTVNFPSRDPFRLANPWTEPLTTWHASTRSYTETSVPFWSGEYDNALWSYDTFCPLPDGTVTKTRLSVRKPLRAGQLKIIKARLYPNGVVTPDDLTVGVSVQLDWSPGMQFPDIPLGVKTK